MEKPGIELAPPGLQGIGLSPTPRRLFRVLAEAKYALSYACISIPCVYNISGECFTDFQYYDLSNTLTMECQVHVVHLIIAL